MIKEEQLTPEVRNELNYLKLTNQTAFDMLVSNFNGNFIGEISFKDIVSRLQTQYAVAGNEDSLKTIAGWNQNEYNEPHEVNMAIPAVTPGKYSSFALKDIHEDFEMNYPLDNDYAIAGMPYSQTDISATQLGLGLKQLTQKLGITVEESAVVPNSTYKTPNRIISGAILKIKNVFLKLAKKPELKSNIFKGKMMLQTRVGGYNVSNVEKLIKAYDLVLKKSIERDAKQIKQHTKEKVSPEIKYASRLFADVLMTRVNDLGNIKNNQIAEQGLWLQFAGALNRYGFHADDLRKITELGSMAVANTCVDLGITKEKVVERMTALGFTYTSVPTNIAQALLNVNQKEATKDEIASNEFWTPGISKIDPEHPINLSEITPKQDEIKDTLQEQESSTSTSLVELPRQTESKAQNIKATTVEKNVDKLVVKFLANVTTQLADKIDSGKIKGKKLDRANAQLRMYNLTLAYYVQATHKKAMAVKGDYTESEISKAKQLVTGLLKQKQEVAKMISSSEIERTENQTSSSYMNAVCKQNLNYTLRDYFLTLIKGCVDYCVDQQFGKETNPKDDVKDEILSLVGDLESQKTDYVPNFVIVDKPQADKVEEETKPFYPYKEKPKPNVEQLEMDLGLEKQPEYEQLEWDLKLENETNEEKPNFVFVDSKNQDGLDR